MEFQYLSHTLQLFVTFKPLNWQSQGHNVIISHIHCPPQPKFPLLYLCFGEHQRSPQHMYSTMHLWQEEQVVVAVFPAILIILPSVPSTTLIIIMRNKLLCRMLFDGPYTILSAITLLTHSWYSSIAVVVVIIIVTHNPPQNRCTVPALHRVSAFSYSYSFFANCDCGCCCSCPWCTHSFIASSHSSHIPLKHFSAFLITLRSV